MVSVTGCSSVSPAPIMWAFSALGSAAWGRRGFLGGMDSSCGRDDYFRGL
ncbi:MAG: hypothetical protein LBR73_05625 [Oscillospiraceae bacterium]|nr:hypothetical protein [Oscillospiraceae bacterium]